VAHRLSAHPEAILRTTDQKVRGSNPFKRTLFAYLFVISLPVIVALAVKFGTSGNSSGPTRFGSGTADLIGLATKGAANFTNQVALQRILIIGIYLALVLFSVAGLAFYLSVSTDVPLGAVGGAIGIIILSNILDAISGLGSIRNWLPTHYSFSWFDALSSSIDWSQMIRGAAYSVILSALFVSLAIIKFNKKDITS